MNINYKQPQFELFPANSATLEDINKPKFLLANLTFSLESLVILTILGIMLVLFAFSLGVERGKHIAAQALDERVSAAWNVGARTVMPAVAVPLVRPRATPVVGRYTIQLSTYSNQIYARQDALRLKSKGFQSFLIKNGKYWLVCVGYSANKEGALALLKKLPGQYRFSQIRRF